MEYSSSPQKQKVTSQIIEKNYDDLTNSNHKKVTSGVIPQKVQTREEFILPRPCNEQNGTKTMGLDQIEP
jgi:hypothetical protein